jgi:hypothetical protein
MQFYLVRAGISDNPQSLFYGGSYPEIYFASSLLMEEPSCF